MNMMDKILEKMNLSYEDLDSAERDVLDSMVQSMQRNPLTIESVKEYIRSMKASVEEELCKTEHNSKQDIFLKARLRNYMLLESLLTSPERAEKAIEASLSGLKSAKP